MRRIRSILVTAVITVFVALFTGLLIGACGGDDDTDVAGPNTGSTATPVVGDAPADPFGDPPAEVAEPNATGDDLGSDESDEPITTRPVDDDEQSTPVEPADEPVTPIPVEPAEENEDSGPPPLVLPDDIGDPTETPIPVEPDGGIGDGAGPPPGVEDEPQPEGDWHGAVVAETNCPGTDFRRVFASAFSFSVPSDFEDQQVQGVDSEVGQYLGNGFELSYDYGAFSNPLLGTGVVENTPVDYSGRVGYKVLIDGAEAGFLGEIVGIHFPVDSGLGGPLLTITVRYDNPEDRIVAECIVGSIDWA